MRARIPGAWGAAVVAAVLSVAVHGACSDSPTVTDSPSASLTLRDDLPPYYEHVIGIEREFERISEAVPEFAGFHYGDDGELVVSVTDLTKVDLVRPLTEQVAATRSRVGDVPRQSTFR